MIVERLKRLIFDNFLIKVVSFLVAVTLWLYVTSKGDVEVNFAVPLELRDVPSSLKVVGSVTDSVNVRLKGRQSAIRGLSQERVHVGVDLSEAKEGENHFLLSDENVLLPMDVEVVRIVPRTISLHLVRLNESKK